MTEWGIDCELPTEGLNTFHQESTEKSANKTTHSIGPCTCRNARHSLVELSPDLCMLLTAGKALYPGIQSSYTPVIPGSPKARLIFSLSLHSIPTGFSKAETELIKQC